MDQFPGFDTPKSVETVVESQPAKAMIDAKANEMEQALLENIKSQQTENKLQPVYGKKELALYEVNDNVINLYEEQLDADNPQGYMVVREETTELQSAVDVTDPLSMLKAGRVRKIVRSAIANGTVEELKELQAALTSGKYPDARIFTAEYLESEVAGMKGTSLSEEAYENRIKRAGSNDSAPYITKGGERIMRISKLDLTGTVADRLIAHDNHAELSEFAKAMREEAAAEV